MAMFTCLARMTRLNLPAVFIRSTIPDLDGCVKIGSPSWDYFLGFLALKCLMHGSENQLTPLLCVFTCAVATSDRVVFPLCIIAVWLVAGEVGIP